MSDQIQAAGGWCAPMEEAVRSAFGLDLPVVSVRRDGSLEPIPPVDDGAEFGFRVARRQGTGWHVFLPHQCQTWDIAGDESCGDETRVALERLGCFIKEAEAACRALAEGREFGVDEEMGWGE